MNRTKYFLLTATALGLFGESGQALAQSTGAAVVFLPAPAGASSPDTDSRAISADGRTIAGAAGNNGLYIWTNGVPVEVPTPAFGGFRTSAISGDGQTITGENTSSGTRVALIYRTNIGFTELPDPAANEIAIFSPSVNSDGTMFAVTSVVDNGRFPGCSRSYICGEINRAYRWSAAGGYQSLGTFGATWSLSTSGISGDGNVISGVARDTATRPSILVGTAFRWTPNDGLQALPSLTPATGSPSFAASNGISRDGSTIVGSSRGADGLFQAVYWRGSTITALGYVPGTNPVDAQTDATATNGDGSIIVGTNNLSRAWRWSATSGMQDLNLIATNAGINLGGFVLTDAVGVSDNGQFITGNSRNAAQDQFLGYVLQLAQVTQSRLIVTLRGPGVTQTSIVNQTFSTQVDGLLNGASVFTRTVADPITGTLAVNALADARASLEVGSGLRRVVIGTPTLISNTTTVLSTTNSTVDVPTGTSTTTATVNTFGPATVRTGDLGTCATAAANNMNPTGCSLQGTATIVDGGILNSNVFTNTINSVTPTTTPTVNQLISARWQVSATAGNQFGTVHALVGPATFERGDRFVGQLTSGRSRRNLVSLDDVQASLFGGYSGGQSKIDADAKIPVAATKGSHDAFTIGGERRINQHLAVGAAFDHGTSDFKVQDPQYGERLELKQTQVGVFGTFSSGRASLSGALSYGFGDVETTLATPNGTARANRDAKSWTLGVEGAYDVPLGSSATLALIGGARTTNVDLQAFNETGGSSPLRGLGSAVDRTRIYAGFDLRGQFKAGNAQIEPSLYARTAQDSGDKNGVADVVFASTPSGPTLQALGPNFGKAVTEYGAALSATLSTNTRLTLGYDATTRDNATTSSARLGLSVAW